MNSTSLPSASLVGEKTITLDSDQNCFWPFYDLRPQLTTQHKFSVGLVANK